VSPGSKTVTVPKSGKHREYVRYAEHCLNMMGTTKDQESRSIHREMAAEWLKLADDVLRQVKWLK
jgi:hypothetical protein